MEKNHSEIMTALWRVKDELSSQYSSFGEFFDALLKRQEESKRRGVKFVSFSLQHPEFSSAQTGG